jgi:predicted RNA-binding Zn-ribbon protein involved in translation (DUF1610 family)
MSGFRYHCPKCGSSNIYVRDEPPVSWLHQIIQTSTLFSCKNCGKQLSGDRAKDELHRQKAAWQSVSTLDNYVTAAEASREAALKKLEDFKASSQARVTSWAEKAQEILAAADQRRASLRRLTPEYKNAMNLFSLDAITLERLSEEIGEQRTTASISTRLNMAEQTWNHMCILQETIKELELTCQQVETVQPEPVVEAKPETRVSRVKIQLPDLETMSIDALRKYATHELGVPRASKIPGGKPALLKACREAIQAQGV